MVLLTVGLKLTPVFTNVPPTDASYQLIVPALADAESATLPGPQRLPPVTEAMAGIVLTVAVTAVLAAVVQPPLVVVADT